MTRTLAATIATVLIVITIVVASAAYAVEIHTISQDASYVLHEVTDTLAEHPVRPPSPRSTLQAIMTRLYHPGLTVAASDDRIGYLGRWNVGRARYEISIDPAAHDPFGLNRLPAIQRVSFFLARSFGCTGWTTKADGIVVIVQADPVVLGAAFERLVGLVLAVSLVAGLVAAVAARRLTERALTPLELVLTALESFAAGDLEPRLIETRTADRRDELGRLTIAYNGAIATVDRALAERARAEEQMRQFIADAGHQLQTPLTVVRGFIGILRRNEVRSPDDLPRILDTMDRQSSIMAQLIKKLMLLQDWERNGEAQATPIEIGSLVKEIALPIAGANPERDIRLTTVNDAWARVSPSELTYAISNLIDNAIKYAADGEIDVNVVADEGLVYIEVRDRGAGMKQEDLGRIFDRFYRGSRRDVPGSGLGLAIAKRAVERAHGTLSARSTPGEGSSFTIALPRARSATSSTTAR